MKKRILGMLACASLLIAGVCVFAMSDRDNTPPPGADIEAPELDIDLGVPMDFGDSPDESEKVTTP